MHLDRLEATEAAQTLSRPRPHMDALRKPRAAKSRSVSATEHLFSTWMSRCAEFTKQAV